MHESFMKYDRDNPPAGVNEDGVFSGGGGGVERITLDQTANPTTDSPTSMYGFANGEDLISALERGAELWAVNPTNKEAMKVISINVAGSTGPNHFVVGACIDPLSAGSNGVLPSSETPALISVNLGVLNDAQYARFKALFNMA